MAKGRLRYIQAVTNRNRTYYYFRRGKIRVAIPGEPHSPEFMRRYRQLLEERPTDNNKATGQTIQPQAAILE